MDQFSAHLDRGWDLAQRGDLKGAEISARRALEVNDQSPEAHNLLGFIEAMLGNYEEALEQYRFALALDEHFLEALLNAAELCIHPLGEFEEANLLCDEALELIESQEEEIDTLLLKFDALLGLELTEEAKQLCLRFPSPPYDNPTHSFLIGRAFYESGQFLEAGVHLEAACKSQADNPEALYYLGLFRDEQGDIPGATQAFLRSRDLDARQEAPPWALSHEAMFSLAVKCVSELPAPLKFLVHTEEIYVADLPGVEVVVDGVDPRAAILIDALDENSEDGSAARIYVYQRNLERLAGSIDNLSEILEKILLAELSAFLQQEASGTDLAPLAS